MVLEISSLASSERLLSLADSLEIISNLAEK